MAEELLLILAYLVILGMGASLILWVKTSLRLHRGGSLLALVPRKRVVWDHAELLMTFGMWILMSLTTATLLRRWGIIDPSAKAFGDLSVDQRTTAMLVSALGQLLVASMFVTWLAFRSRKLNVPFFEKRLFASRIRFGFVAALMLIPPTMMIQVLVTQIIPYSHDLLDMVDEGVTPFFCAVALFSGAIVAPISEEIFFRMLLQGWLESAAGRQAPAPVVWVPDTEEPESQVNGRVLTAYAPPATTSSTDLNWHESYIIPPLWPILVSSSLFAIAHLGQGPAPIPLFFLSLGLGYLYRQTNSILPCIVVHFSLNAMSLTFAMLSSVANASALPVVP